MGRFIGGVGFLAGLGIAFIAVTKPDSLPYNPLIFLGIGILVMFMSIVCLMNHKSLQQRYYPVYR